MTIPSQHPVDHKQLAEALYYAIPNHLLDYKIKNPKMMFNRMQSTRPEAKKINHMNYEEFQAYIDSLLVLEPIWKENAELTLSELIINTTDLYNKDSAINIISLLMSLVPEARAENAYIDSSMAKAVHTMYE